MDFEVDRLRFAQWVFERNVAWIASAEVKAGFVCVVDSAMLGGLATAFIKVPLAQRPDVAYVVGLLAAAVLLFAVLATAMVYWPRTDGPSRSLIFAGRIAELRASDFEAALRGVSMDELVTDFAAQIHRNAEIAIEKFEWVRKSVYATYVGAIPWALSLLVLARV